MLFVCTLGVPRRDVQQGLNAVPTTDEAAAEIQTAGKSPTVAAAAGGGGGGRRASEVWRTLVVGAAHISV